MLGKKRAQGSSCFLLQIPEDSLDSIYDTLKQCAKISQHAGGIGLSIHKIRGKGSIIKSSGGPSDGIVPMLRVYNDTARYVNQGGKRKGAFAIYLEPWHADILDFLDLKKNRGAEASRSRDLHYGLWIPDLFMKRVQNDERWSLFSQDTAPNLCEVWEKSLKHYMHNTRLKEEQWKYFLLEKSGHVLLNLKPRQENHTCCTRMHVIENQINKTWVLFMGQICVVKLFNIHRQMKLPFVIWHLFVCHQ